MEDREVSDDQEKMTCWSRKTPSPTLGIAQGLRYQSQGDSLLSSRYQRTHQQVSQRDGVFVSFELDENFNETIKSRHRDNFSYMSFSEGEKMRIDLAILLAWREVSRLKNSANTNLLILDEVFDASLDAIGSDDFLKLLDKLSTRSHIFVISHKADQLVDKFQNQVSFQKQGNFSLTCVTYMWSMKPPSRKSCYNFRVTEIVKVVDGDTIDVIIDLGFDLYKKERVRVAGVDTPEKRTRNLEKELGIDATNWLTEQLDPAIDGEDDLVIRTEIDGGSANLVLLGWLYIGEDTESINERMIREG